ncbi:MAG: DUF1801 domain-containing protein [Thermomicrobiales bacterium]
MAKIETVEEYYGSLESPLRKVAEKLGTVIDSAIPDCKHAMWHGSPVWSFGPAPGKQPVALIKAYPKYVTFGLWRGRDVDDPKQKIDTKGSMAGVKYASVEEVDSVQLTIWLQQARDLEAAAE